MSGLAQKKCAPCSGSVPALKGSEIDGLLANLDQWKVVDGHHLTKQYSFPDFAAALAFVVRVGAVAEEEQHHPDVNLSWGTVRLDLWTHKINGLTENDFILAAKIDELG